MTLREPGPFRERVRARLDVAPTELTVDEIETIITNHAEELGQALWHRTTEERVSMLVDAESGESQIRTDNHTVTPLPGLDRGEVYLYIQGDAPRRDKDYWVSGEYVDRNGIDTFRNIRIGLAYPKTTTQT